MNTSKDDNLKIRRLLDIDKSVLPPDGGDRFNRLIFARSPYLLQHAENPVDWHQWGDEAFAIAKRADKPVFLSIGYATCHWCHVMEHESFEDDSVAEVLNRHFVSIKVDREERPDVDDQYMTVAQMVLEGGGGWPLTLFLDHDKKPFYVTTYIPKRGNSGIPGIIEVLESIAEVWKNKRDVVESTCAAIIKDLSSKAEPIAAPVPEISVLADAASQLKSIYDKEAGGFGAAPKFPRPIFLSFLMRTHNRDGDNLALKIAVHSLKMMRQGGIFDQFGFGFHRYSVDSKWLVPHFEKMLYDQAMLAIAYLEAFQIAGDVFFRETAGEIFAFVRNEMTSPEGGFYSAIDADSEGSEGKYYLWTPSQVRSIIGEDAAKIVCKLFDITEVGNFEGENIPHLTIPLDEFASSSEISGKALRSDLEKWRRLLFDSRETRIRPLRDEKILTSWNGLMIAALAKGFAVTGDHGYLDMAENALSFIKNRLMSPEGRLLRSHYAGESAVPGFLEDYAFLVWGLIELYEATLNIGHLNEVGSFSREILRLFADESSYGLFDTGNDAENVLVRKKSTSDGVIPSGNSVAAMNFLRLGKITGRNSFVKEGEGILRSLMGDLLSQPINHLHAVSALDYLRGDDLEITLVGKPDANESEEMLRTVTSRYNPGLVLRFRNEGSENTEYKTLNGRTTVYLCSKGLCRPPVAGREAFEKLLGEVAH